ncbi:hypothetical protein G7Y89_g7523 [Cudoniella acicularis]|uniref:SP-RING-type domain-containing protein n=1 Tax=Cudoniella acicularis TaxID=354080 RepID=A0A8H4RJY7_9HELO|nr:hypothetical protein G7Y89_g7523 [Cudoniella acicularis]
MRRPPDKDRNAVLSERDVVSSNSTLNTVFGGARQKSWMVGAGTPVRPTPRANISKAPVSQVSFAQRSMGSVLPSPAPSDEPSPILSNVIINDLRETPRETNTNENQRPSMLSNNRSTQDVRHLASEADLNATMASAAQSQISSPYLPARLQAVETQVPRAAEVQSPAPIDSQNLGATDMQSARPTNSSNPVSSQATDSPRLQNRANLPQDFQPTVTRNEAPTPSQVQSTPEQRPAPRPPPLRLAESTGGSPSVRYFPETGGQQLPSPGQINPMSPRTPSELPLPSTMVHQTRAYPSPVANPMHPYKRQRTQPPAMPSLEPRIALIDQHIESAGGMENLNNALERPRFQLLADACRTEDAFYVALHQIFCVWDLPDPSQITGIPDFPSSKTLLIAFKIIGQLIRENEGLAPNHKKWFARFPSPLADLMKTSEPYRRTVREVGIFLSKLATDWLTFSQNCTARQYPPLVDELVQRMGLLSPILQGVVFTAMRRNLGITDEPVGHKMEDVFKRDRKDHQTLANRYNTARPPTDKEIKERNQILANEYLLLRNQHFQARRPSGSTAGNPLNRLPTPVAPSTSNFQPTSLAVSQAEALQNPRRQNTSSPNIPGNWQPAARHPPPPVRMNSTSSPNPAVVAMTGRPPSVSSQNGYQNTPSPIPMQGLSMQSPVQQAFPMLRSNDNQVQPRQGQAYSPVNQNAVFHQNQPQNPDPRPQQTQLSTQQLQQLAAQQQYNVQQVQQQQQLQLQYQHPAQLQPQQVQLQFQHPAQQQQHPQYQHPAQHHQAATMQQHSQQQMQQVLNMNRAAQIRRDSTHFTDSQHRPVSRTNSVSSTGRRTPNGQSPRMVQGVIIDPGSRIVRQNQPHPLDRSLLPPLTMPPMQPISNPDITALHQAHLRSPILVVSRNSQVEKPQDDPSHRFYQTVRGFAFGPTAISKDSPITKFEFQISDDEFVRVARDHPTYPGKPNTRELKSGSLQYRLRCIQTRRDVTMCLTPDWVVTDTSWPDTTFLSFNRAQLELRRKYHHGKDLPVDVTPHVLNSGPNVMNRVTITTPKWRQKLKDVTYFFAVEVIEVFQHKQIMDTVVHFQRIPSSTTLDAIKKSLAPKDDDDDFAMVIGDLVIDLADPFTARIFEIPVRGSSCLHRECFDLETFLLTRNSKLKRPQQPCMPDIWKCPLCSKDARPYNLQVDEFLLSVREELASRNQLDVKAILISPDGNWKPRVEATPKRKASKHPYDDDSTDDEASQQRLPSVPAEKGNNRVVEVIDLDD